MASRNQRNGWALLWIFTASGFAGLIYESIWTHYLGLILGHSAYAQVLVLALFMGGMALGAWIISRRSEALKRPLAVYAIVEFVLGVFGVGFHGYFQLVSAWAYESIFPALAPGLSLELARWTIAGLLILPQCVLLGMTFPLMSAGYMRWQPEASGKILAGLYFSNSLGAACGALAATFILLPAIGLPGAVLTAGVLSIAVAIAVWPLAKLEQPMAVASSVSKEKTGTWLGAPTFILAMAAVTGASSFVYEVSWVRMLSMVLGSTVHAFEIMLAAFISGIAFGGLWLRKRADGLASPRRAAGWAQIAMGCMALSTLFLYNQSFSWLAWILSSLNRSAESAYGLYNVASAVISMVIMFPTAFFAGMTLPLLTLALLREGAGEAAVGKAYAANTLGAITGVVAVVFLGLPLLGLRLSLWVGAALDIAIGILLLRSLGGFRLGRGFPYRQPAAILSSLVLLTGALVLSEFDTVLMSSAVFRDGILPTGDHLKVFSHVDGRTASVTLREVDKDQRAIFTNGKPDASIRFSGSPAIDEITMMVAGVVPMLHHPKAKTAAIIGFGSGMTTHFMLGNPTLESVDTVEIEPAMVNAASYFRPVVERAFTDPRSHIVIDDAKSYFATTRNKYDIIVSEPSNPWVSGVASLFTEEFYAFIPKHLNEGGVFAQWIQAYEISPALINSITRAMMPHFAEIRIFAAGETDWLLVASPVAGLPKVDGFRFPGEWNASFRKEMADRGISGIEDVHLLYIGDRPLLESYSELYPHSGTNSDFFPILQLNAPKARFSRILGIELAEYKQAQWPLFEVVTGVRPVSLDYPIKQPLVYRWPLAGTTQNAQAIAKALLGRSEASTGDGILLDESLAVARLRTAGHGCSLDEMAEDGLTVLTRLAARTIPYLPADIGNEMWAKPKWYSCPVQKSVPRQYLSFLGAVATRNHAEVIKIGNQLLRDPLGKAMLEKSKPAFRYVVGAMQLAALAKGDNDMVLALERDYPDANEGIAHQLVLVTARRHVSKTLSLRPQ